MTRLAATICVQSTLGCQLSNLPLFIEAAIQV